MKKLNSDIVKFVKSKDWYLNNLDVDSCIIQNSLGSQGDANFVSITNRIIGLIKNGINEDNSIKYTPQLKKQQYELELFSKIPDNFRKLIENFLLSKDAKSFIQDHIK